MLRDALGDKEWDTHPRFAFSVTRMRPHSFVLKTSQISSSFKKLFVNGYTVYIPLKFQKPNRVSL